MELQIKQVVTKNSHHFISLLIVHVENIQVVKAAIERFADLEFKVNNSVKNS